MVPSRSVVEPDESLARAASQAGDIEALGLLFSSLFKVAAWNCTSSAAEQ